jgi:hypothetical protein
MRLEVSVRAAVDFGEAEVGGVCAPQAERRRERRKRVERIRFILVSHATSWLRRRRRNHK